MLKQDDGQTQRKIADLKKILIYGKYKEIRHLDKDVRSQATYGLDRVFNGFFIAMIKLINCNEIIDISADKTFDRITKDVRSCSRHYYPGWFAKPIGEDIFRRLMFDFKNPTHIGRRT